jgi:lysophospholipase L1-like esterase
MGWESSIFPSIFQLRETDCDGKKGSCRKDAPVIFGQASLATLIIKLTTTPAREVLAKANKILSRLDDGKTIHFMDINNLFVQADGTITSDLMPDFEHPSAKGYQLWSETIEPVVARLMGEK